jgi:hypothetical protein
MNEPLPLQTDKFQRTRESIQALLSADLDRLRLTASAICAEFHFENRDAWIATASKRQLLAEVFYILTNNLA